MPSSPLTYKYRLKDSTARKHLVRQAWAVNIVWNFCNEVSMLALRRDKKWLTAFDLINLTQGASKDLGIPSDTISRICTEYATRRRQHCRPRLNWRSRKRSLGWIPFKGRQIALHGDAIRFGKRRYRLWFSRPVKGEIKAGSFTQDARGRWYVSLQCEVPLPELTVSSAEIGIDLGLKTVAACSDGTKLERANVTRRYADKLAMAQRARKKRRVAAIHAKIRNVRKDWTHKRTSELAGRAKRFVIGNVSPKKLVRTKMAKSVHDVSWYDFKTCLTYKANRLGASVIEVNESFSSVTCSACLQRTGPSGLSALGVREWCCTHCGVIHDRDTNAAHNILRLGRQTPIKGIPSL